MHSVDSNYRFYFDGDSFTYGGGLKEIGVVPEDVRWARLVCDHFGAEEINLSSGGASNDKVMRQVFGKPTTEVHDFYFLQTSIPNRYEFYDTKKKAWMNYRFLRGKSFGNLEDKCIRRWGSIEGPMFAQWIEFGLQRIYSDFYGETKENITYNALKSYVASIGRARRSFFSTLLHPSETNNKYDLYFSNQLNFDRIPNDGHPSVEGHKTIAKYIIDIVSERLS